MKSAELQSKSSLSLPADSYIYDVLSVTGNDNVATVSSNDALRVVDNSLHVLPNGAVENIHRVTCLENFEARAGCLVAAGDAVSVWDLYLVRLRRPLSRSRVFRIPARRWYRARRLSSCRQCMVGSLTKTGGTTDLMMSVRDCRAPKEPLVRYVESHSDDVTVVQ